MDVGEPMLAKPRGKPKRGGMAVTVVGCAFFAYAFNLGGLQGSIDGVLHGADRNLKSHNGQVAAAVMVWMPYVALVFGLLVLLYMGSVAISLLGSGPKKAKKPAKPKASAGKMPEPVRPPDAVVIKPMRLP